MTAVTQPPTRLVPMAALTVILALSIAGTGCKDEKKLTPPVLIIPYLAQSSAANILSNLQRAYKDRDIDEYTKLLAPDFVFVFNPLDPTDPDHPTPPHWGLADELSSATNMFADSSVLKIELSSFALGVPERADSLLYGPRTWKVRVDQANLQVYTRREDGSLLTLLVEGATEVFLFREDLTRLASDGKPTWFILRWEDQPIGWGKTEAGKSWGQIKALYL